MNKIREARSRTLIAEKHGVLIAVGDIINETLKEGADVRRGLQNPNGQGLHIGVFLY